MESSLMGGVRAVALASCLSLTMLVAQAPLHASQDGDGHRRGLDRSPSVEVRPEVRIEIPLEGWGTHPAPGQPTSPARPAVPASPATPAAVDTLDCEAIEQRLTVIQQRMDAPNRYATDGRLGEERRALEIRHQRDCR